jgi:hypothetical protein
LTTLLHASGTVTYVCTKNVLPAAAGHQEEEDDGHARSLQLLRRLTQGKIKEETTTLVDP